MKSHNNQTNEIIMGNQPTKRPHYDIDKDISVEMLVQDKLSCYVSIYNDRNDKSVAFQTSRDKMKGLADFIYQIIGEEK